MPRKQTTPHRTGNERFPTRLNIMQRTIENITKMLAHQVDPAAMRTIVPTLLFIRNLGPPNDAGPSPTPWDTLRQNPDGLNLDELIEQTRKDIATADPQLADAMPRSEQAQRLRAGETKQLTELIDRLTADTDIGDAYQQILHRLTPRSAQRQGQFFTPASVAELMAKLIPARAQSIYDPAAGAGNLLIHGHDRMSKTGADVVACGQEINPATVRLAKMNLAIRNINAELREGDTIERDLFPGLLADAVVANPPFGMKFKGSKEPIEPRWKFGEPPPSNANFAWLQHCLHHTSNRGTALVIMPSGTLQSTQGNERKIRKNMIENGNVRAIIALPPKLFATTTVPVVIWIMAKAGIPERGTLMVDAHDMGSHLNRRQNELSQEEIGKIAQCVEEWRRRPGEHPDQPGLTKAVTQQEMRENEFSLNPARYVEPPPRDESGVDPIQAALDDLREAQARSREASERMWEMLEQMGYGVPP